MSAPLVHSVQKISNMSAPLAHSAPQVGDGTHMWAFPLHPTKQWADRVVKGMWS